MPKAPDIAAADPTGLGSSPMQPPSQANLLMAAAEMHKMGRLPTSERPDIVHPRNPKRKLKLVK